MGYGDTIYKAHGEELIRTNRERIELITWAFTQLWAVDIFPVMRFIPSWFPGANFRKIGETGTRQAKKIRFWPYEMVVNAIVSAHLLNIYLPTLTLFFPEIGKSRRLCSLQVLEQPVIF